MTERLLKHKPASKLLQLLIFATLLTVTLPSVAQKTSAKTKTTKSSPKRAIYGLASFYADKFNGRQTANGEIFSQKKFTCACNILPLNTWVKITNLKNGKTVIVKTNDRLHPRMRRIADLSKIAAKTLGYTSHGIIRIKMEVLGKKRPKNVG